METGSTGDERVDATLAALGALPETPVAGHVAIFERVHRGLQQILTDADGPGQGAGGAGLAGVG